LLTAAIWLLSPILKTLTEPMSDDTLLAWTIALFLIHLAAQDYSYLTGLSEKFTAPVSLNAAIFAASVIVSRLPSVTHVVVFIWLAILCFALFPILRRAIHEKSTLLHLFCTWSAAGLTAFMLVPLSTALSVLYVITLLFATFVGPAWLIHIQQYKNTIHGPWDEAIPTRSRANWKG